MIACGCSSLRLYECSLLGGWAVDPMVNAEAAEWLRANEPQYRGACTECPDRDRQPAQTDTAVIVTCHNYGRYLRECLDSVLAQTLQPTHVIVVDDASDDETVSIYRKYHPEVQYLHGEWRDVAAARNAGLAALPRTRFVLFVDADNVLPADYLRTLMDGMDSPTIGVCYAPLDRFTDRGEFLGPHPAIRPYSLSWLRRANLADTCSLIRRPAFDVAGGWRQNNWGLHDWDLWLRITAGGWSMRLCEGAPLRYRVHAGQMSLAARNPWSGVEIMRDCQQTTIVTLFSGRAWSLDRWFSDLHGLRWNRDNLHLVAVDNSADQAFRDELRGRLLDSGLSHTYLRDDSRILPGIPAAQFADDGSARVTHGWALNCHLSRLYGLATRHVPAGSALVWSIEDDVGFPSDALERLALELYVHQDAGAVAASMRNRFADRDLIAWDGDRRIERPPHGARPVTAVGFYCLLARREAWDSIAWRPGVSGLNTWPYYDHAACADLRAAGHRIYLSGDVRCRHWQANGTAIEV